MFSLIIANIVKLALAIVSFVSLILFGRCKRLAKKNAELENNAAVNKKIITIQQKIIDVKKKTQDTDFSGNLKRMRNEEF